MKVCCITHAIILLENKMGVVCAEQQPDGSWKEG